MKIKNRKELWLTSFLVIVLSIIIVSCIDENIEVLGECPVVISTDPANSTDNSVPLSQVVNATFNTDMDPSTLTAASFRLMGSAAVAGSFSFDEGTRTLSFDPNEPLDENSTYTATVFRTVKDVTFEVRGSGENDVLSPFSNKFPEERAYNRTVVIDIIPQ